MEVFKNKTKKLINIQCLLWKILLLQYFVDILLKVKMFSLRVIKIEKHYLVMSELFITKRKYVS